MVQLGFGFKLKCQLEFLVRLVRVLPRFDSLSVQISYEVGSTRQTTVNRFCSD
ncbi:hypothetical protein Hanom_Chr06g00518911 [Helianthus anomalus]